MRRSVILAIAITLCLGGCSKKSAEQGTIMDMETFTSFEACLAKAHADRSSRTDIKKFSEKQKENEKAGLYMSEIILNDGGFLRQLCLASRHNREVAYTLMGAGPSIKGGTAIHAGLVMPGNLVILKVENFKSKELCEEEARKEMQSRTDVSNIDYNNKKNNDYTVVTLNNGGHFVYVCRPDDGQIRLIIASPIGGPSL